MLKNLRLLITEKCNRDCSGCCNKDWDLKSLPVCESFWGFDKIILTGGEPMLFPDLIKQVICEIRKETLCGIYLYTANLKNPKTVLQILSMIDGMTVTLHDQGDVQPFEEFCEFLDDFCKRHKFFKLPTIKSMRLNIFKGVLVTNIPPYWDVKDNIEWIKNCPLPQNEVFMRWEHAT